METSRSMRITDESGVGAARREAAALGRSLALDEQTAGRLAIVVNELGHNLCRHARGGELVVRRVEAGGKTGVEVLALDKGPGMADVGRALGDGYSTRGSAGTGLGAVRRQSQEFDIYSQVGAGTAVLARIFGDGGRMTAPTIGGVCVAKPGEEIAGDGWLAAGDAARTVIMVADGLGHGPDAAAASRAATTLLRREWQRAPSAILEAAHAELKSTRGAAVAVAAVERATRELVFSGIGNIFAQIVHGADASTVGIPSAYGTIGGDVRRIHDQRFPFAGDDLLLFATDGVRPKWSWTTYPGLLRRDPALVAAVLYRDYSSGRDDSTVVVSRDT
jgi:anti-sigma regulatory factor (Ser/Thr protein kinase)